MNLERAAKKGRDPHPVDNRGGLPTDRRIRSDRNFREILKGTQSGAENLDYGSQAVSTQPEEAAGRDDAARRRGGLAALLEGSRLWSCSSRRTGARSDDRAGDPCPPVARPAAARLV